MIATWTLGLIRRQPGRLLGTATGVAAAVALLACLGSFLAAAQSAMTARAAVQSPSTGRSKCNQTARHPACWTGAGRPHVVAASPVGFAQSSGLSATGAGSIRTTGPQRYWGSRRLTATPGPP
jgi:putative ABC transport system permease protein